MCNASIDAKHTRDANPGDTVRLTKNFNCIPFFHSDGDPEELVTCLQNGSEVEVTDVPLQTARELETETEFMGVFAQDRHDEDDAILLLDGRFISLCELSQRGAPSLYFSGMLSEPEMQAFEAACEEYFDEPRMSVATDWGCPPEPVSGNEQPSERTGPGVVVDRLPAALHADGTSIVLGHPVPEGQLVQGSRIPELLDA
jgi:hypothetical protein